MVFFWIVLPSAIYSTQFELRLFMRFASLNFRRLAAVVPAAIVLATSTPVFAANYDLCAAYPNAGFESGGLTGWTYTNPQVNVNTYLTLAEWTAQTWTSSSPFYTDAQLATFYPGRPWGLNPNITHIDQTGFVGDPTTTLVAPVGANFVGSRQDGYDGHYRRAVSEPAQPAGGFYDTNWQITSGAIAGSFQSGDTFTLRVWGNRGRLGSDWAQNNASSAGSASSLNVRLVGGTYATPAYDFTSWGPDGQWTMQVFTWTLTSSATSVRIRVTGQNSNHNRYVAYDACDPSTPASPTTWGHVKSQYR
jgi:hypothetical protein